MQKVTAGRDLVRLQSSSYVGTEVTPLLGAAPVRSITSNPRLVVALAGWGQVPNKGAGKHTTALFCPLEIVQRRQKRVMSPFFW